jgi:N-glycosylase/DNA lyase
MNRKNIYPISVAIIAVKYKEYPIDIPIPAATQIVAAMVKPAGEP